MHRQRLLHQLAAYQSKHPQESDTCERFTRFVRDTSDCFERSQSYGHVTGSAWVVNAAGTHTLLTHHKKLEKWLQLGGHTDGEADVLKSAFREVEEESGLSNIEAVTEHIFDLDIHSIPARKQDPEHYHFDVRFAFRVTGSEKYTVSEESLDLAWVPISQLEEYTDEVSMLRMAQKWIDQQYL